MNLNTVVSVELTWSMVQKICNLFAEVGRSDLIRPFEEAVKYAQLLEEQPDAYTRM